MSPKLILLIVSFLYRIVLRDLLVKAIADPDEEWDDEVLALIDNLLSFGSNPGGMFGNPNSRSDLSDEEKSDEEQPVKIVDNPNL